MKQKRKSSRKDPIISLKQLWNERIYPLLAANIGRHLIIVFLLSYLVMIGTETFFWFLDRNSYDYQEGDIAQEDIVLSSNLLFLDQEATEKKKALRLATVNPQFVMQENITLRVLDRFDRFRERMLHYLENSGSQIPQDLLEWIPESMLNSIAALDDPQQMLKITREIIVTIMYKGYFRLLSFDYMDWEEDDLIEIITAGEAQGLKTTLPLGEILMRDNVEPFIDSQMHIDVSSLERENIKALVIYFIEENCYYNQVLTDEQKTNVSQMVDPVYIKYSPGDTLIYHGSVLTARDIQKLEALKQQSNSLNATSFLRPLLYLGLILFIGGSFLVFLQRKILKPLNMILTLYLMLFFILYLQFIYKFIVPHRITMQLVLLPTGFITLLLSQILDRRDDLMIYTVLLSLLAFFLVDSGEAFLIYSLISGTAGIMVLPRGEKRIDLFKAGTRLGLVHFMVLLVITLFMGNMAGGTIVDLIIALASGLIFALLVMSLLPLFEHFLNSCTTFRLTELSNLNDPIMKRMFIRAPGTYVHSINVAYMAEPACESIGANALLARVGGYYHDIGKIDQAEYYIENQKEGNKHDELKATLSAAIIKSHVRAGLEKARELRLPTEIMDIIAQHHGTSVIRYFYERAMKDESGKSTVNKDDFCHSGPKPQTKEAAVVMLADTVEAATRTLRKPTRAKLEKYIWDLTIDRFQNGELNDSGLTLKELEIIKDNFVHVLTGHFHSRVEYPSGDKKKNGK